MRNLCFLVAVCIFPLILLADKKPEVRPHPMRLTARHIEPNGIGYTQGYTTLEGFFSLPDPWKDAWFPFLDLRGHVFNDGRLAANAGVGLRLLKNCRVWGANAYYDYRKTQRRGYNQASIGLETLGEAWDFRINGYLPFGEKKSSLYHTEFSRFKGNQIFLLQRYQFAMKGINAEAGAHVDRFKNVPLYFCLGPYYLEGQGKTAWGGQLRAAADICNVFRIEGNASYDNVFKWIGQGQLSLTFSFGRRKEIKDSCCSSLALATRALQRVDRNEIIPVDEKKHESVAIDPATGLPFFVLFVDNTSHSAGSFESPFPTLTQAESVSSPFDLIYIYPGNGLALDGAITLQDSQQLLGASIAHTLPTTIGEITIPASATTLPLINSLSGPTITLGNNNTIAGLNIANSFTNMAIYGNSITNFTSVSNTLSSSVTDSNTTAGVELAGSCTGEFVFKKNTFTNVDIGIYVNGSLTGNLSSTNNAYEANSLGIYVMDNTITGNLSSANDMYNSSASAGVYVYSSTITGSLSCINDTFISATGIELDDGSTINGDFISKNNIFNSGNGITINGSPQNSVDGNFISKNDTFNTSSIGINMPTGSLIGGTFSLANGTFTVDGVGVEALGLITDGSVINSSFASNQGVALTIPHSTTATWTMTGNVFTAEETGGVYPVTIANTNGTSSISLIFNNNSALDSLNNLAEFTANSGTFDLVSESGNTGLITGP